MDYNFEQIDKLMSAKLCDRCKISKLLQIDCMLYTRMGVNSTKKEKQEVKSKSKKIYTYIKKIDSEIGDRLLSSMDQ
jgi:hypothetical protein